MSRAWSSSSLATPYEESYFDRKYDGPTSFKGSKEGARPPTLVTVGLPGVGSVLEPSNRSVHRTPERGHDEIT